MNSYKSLAAVALSLGLLTSAPCARADIKDADFQKAIEKYLSTPAGQEKLGKTLEDYFRKRQESAKKEQEDRQAAEFEEQFKNPVKIDVGNSPVKGPANAKITVVEFSDFQCPFCKRGANTMDELLKAYPNDVRLAFKQLPLPFHNEAMPAAKASLAAGKQGKFWEFHDALFANQDKLSAAFYLQKAKDLGLDVEKFTKDMNAPETEAQVKADMEIGSKNGIQGTPGFFVNGVAVKGAYPIDHFKMIVDRHLGKTAPAKK